MTLWRRLTSWSAVLALAGAGLVVTAAPAAAAGAVPLTTGADALGQQGNGAGGSRLTPGPVSGPAATRIASGRDHAYLLDEGGRVWAWGDNGFGQIGDGSTTPRQAPVQLGLTDVVLVEAGHYHGLAVRSDHTLWTWGYGTLGQLGLGTTANRTSPTQVALSDVVAAVGGRDMSYALTSAGTVYAWGNNTNGELGDGTTTRRTSPILVTGLPTIVELAAGRNHVLALDTDGGVWAWGDNAYGQVGNATTVDQRRPVRIAAGGYTRVDAGAQHSIGVRTDGTVTTWGRGYRGALGLGSTASRTSPTAVPGLTGVVDAGDGRDQSFALTGDGRVYAWGYNAAGQLGDGTTTQRTSPVLLPLTGIVDAVSGSSHTVFLGGAEPGNQPPTVRLAAECEELTCTFSVDATDPDGTVEEVSWTLGDGTTAAGPSVEHTYAAPGSYPVAVTVTDDAGATAAAQTTVNVGQPAATVEYVAGAASNANAATHRVTVPATVQAGDTLLLVLTVNSATTVGTPTGGGAWTLLQRTTGSDYSTSVWSAPATGPGAGVQVTLGAQAKGALAVGAYRGATVDQVALVRETTSRTQHPTPVVTVAEPGSRLVSVWSDKSSATTGWTAPAGVDQRLTSIGTSGGRITLLWADSAAPSGAAGGLVATASSASSKATMLSVVLAPMP